MACRGLILLFISVILSGFLPELKAYLFQVGGRDGWVVTPSENYNHWAGRMRFQVNDTLVFKFKNGTDSVLEVNQADYDNCNTQNPITKMEGGDSFFKFTRSGPFYFISGLQDHCQKGQKIIIVVMAVRNKSSPGAPAPASQSPAPAPTYTSPAPTSTSPAPSSTSPAPSSTSPVASPSLAPDTGDLAPAPAESGSGAGAGPAAPGPESSTTPTTPTTESPSSPGDTSGNSTATSPPKSAGEIVTPSIIFISGVTIVLSLIA